MPSSRSRAVRRSPVRNDSLTFTRNPLPQGIKVIELQGIGQYAAESVDQLDIPPVLAITMYGAFFILLLNTIVDILYAALDPRIRLE